MATRLALAARLRDGRADHDLLREFVQHRSQPAFAELVRRYGPLVIGVCRRSLNHTHDAEDAFQATFLVLARRAARITTPERLAGWLHSVAVRTATEIRHMRDRSAKHRSGDRCHQSAVGGTGLQTGVAEQAEQHELAAALDAELAKLPDHYRLPVVLCELRGMNRKQAAAELKVAEGTLSSRLAKARKLLADRLAKRGFAASVAAVAAALAGSASAHIGEKMLAVATDVAFQIGGELVPASVSLASDTVVKALFATKLKSLAVAGGLMVALAGGLVLMPGGAGAQPGDTPGAKVKADPAEALVRQLGSPEFAEREAAEKELRKLGANALPAVRAGLKSDVPEVVERCARLLPVLRVEHLKSNGHPVWKKFANIAGESKESATLYAEMVGDPRRAEVLEAVVEKPDSAGAVYQGELNRGIKALREGYDAAERRNRNLSGLNHPDSGVPNRGELALLLFLGTFPKTADTTPDAAVGWRDGLHANLFSYALSWSVAGNQNEIPIFDGQKNPLPAPVRKLLAAWLGVRRDPHMIQHGFGLAKSHEVREALPVARRVVADKTYATKERAAALLAVGMFGDTADLPLLEPLFDCPDEFHNTNYTYQGGKQVSIVTQVRDAAYGVALKLHGVEPIDYGYEMCVEYKTRGKSVLQSRYYLGFRSDEARTASHDQVKAFLKTAPKPEPKKDPQAERLVKQLGSPEFAEREAAEKRLREMGIAVLAAVRAGLKSESPEVVQRCERVLAQVRTEGLRATFRKLIGDDQPARDLFDRIRGSGRGWSALVAAADDPSRADDLYATRTKELLRVGRGLPPVSENGKLEVPVWPHMHAPPPVPAEDVFAWLFLGTFTSGTPAWTPTIHPDWRSETDTAWAFLPEEDHSSAQHMGKEFVGPLAAPLKKLTVKWLEKRREKDALRAGLILALRYDIPDALPEARSVLAKVRDQTFDIHTNTAASVALVGEFGTPADVPLLLPHLADERTHVGIITELPKGITGNEGFSIADLPGVKKLDCQIRDLAAAAVLKLSGVDPEKSGFPKWPERKYSDGSPKSPTMMTGVGFRTAAERAAAFERNRVLFKLAPVPKAKPVVPKKLAKMPEASEELRKELFQFDEKYRHGTAEKFAELEKKADELAKRFKEKDDQARIWYEVAHVAAQSDIRKHSERVRMYAAKCLEISRDPLHRPWMYSYLASAEEVSEGVFADRRRKAAGWLLTGYLEMLAQELPDEAPELPAAARKLGDDPQGRANNAAAMAAIVETRFVQEQVFRRDTLVLQLRNLYKPNPKQADRDEKGLDELKALAAKTLPDDAAEKVLVERVMK
jgi:RNA polymerase sigma factor (sigma-70 family)